MSEKKTTPRKASVPKTPAPKTLGSTSKASRSSKTAGAGKGRTSKSPARGRGGLRPHGPTTSDKIGLLVLALTIGLAACTDRMGGSKGGEPKAEPGPTGQVTVRFLDVGQGDAVLIRSPEGKTLLYDGGRSSEKMKDHLQTYGVDKLDLMIASHGDADHIAGLVVAAEQARPKLFINNGLAPTTRIWERLVSALEEAGTTFQKANNQVINLGSVKVRVISPPPGMGDDQNENSVGIRVEFGQFQALMTGDSERPETEAWLEQDRPEIRGPFQLYKSIHHGAANGDHAAWLATVRPENVVIGVGENNYGHPTGTALDLYKQNGVRVYRTDRQGTVTFAGSADGTYTVTTDR